MPIHIYAGHSVVLDEDGYFTEPERWTEEMAPYLAAAEGITELTADHWQVIKVMRAEYHAKGSGPAVRALAKISGVPVKELYRLFPKGPAKVAAKIAGIPKPHSCI
ncbi:TusE/DsrC/DsvC family sulfur relay protein [Streptomyces sp. A7024]|uniref:TusE/DsrC/DsvC family sulfur relay protein n=1 Tax=Streptomyces coryli TaxID=1128680 RepID=A0A6G4TU22_9ACTN|nr:TusE/DsrC/DsvC family sulfur relay protein [Streptomyces coryli]NGN62491.1 TusE/DsrC/DsvC family sulfur relay protein [Streptomyces coryli]